MSAVTVEQLQRALDLVHTACADFVLEGYLSQDALARMDQWLQRLPTQRANPQYLALNIGLFLERPGQGNGQGDGATLDGLGRASMEALVLHYEEMEPNLFPMATVASARARLASSGGPRYTGPWP